MLDTERLFLRAYQESAQRFGHAIPRELYKKMIGHREDTSRAILEEGMPSSAPVSRIIKTAQKLYLDLIMNNGVTVMPGVIELLVLLDEIKMPRGVATSTNYELACTKLESVELLNRFDHITTGDQVEKGKPAPDIFLRAAYKLNTPPENCLVLEDSFTGLQGAKAAGMMAVLIPDLTEPTPEMEAMADSVFPSLVEFIACFKAVAVPG